MPAGYTGPEDPEKGVPYRHTRARAQLMLAHATQEQMRRALQLLIWQRPGEALDALCASMDPDTQQEREPS